MGRRRFLIAAGLTSISALTAEKLPGIVSRPSRPGVAKAADEKGRKNIINRFNNH